MSSFKGLFDIVESLLPNEAIKSVIFCEIENTAYEISYYSYFADGSCKQCYELEADNVVEAGILENGFEKMAAFIREDAEFDAEKRNIVTLLIEGTKESIVFEKIDKSIGLYKIKKEWKSKYL